MGGRPHQQPRGASNGTSVLIVDDNPAVTDVLGTALVHEGYGVSAANGADEAMKAFADVDPDVVLLDLVFPDDISGVDICRKLRQRSAVPIVMISARTTERDVIEALEAGADDYLTKPFGIPELVARIRAVVRRRPQGASRRQPEFVELGDLCVDSTTHRAWVGGKLLDLPLKEFQVLAVLIRNACRVVPRDALVGEVWGHVPVSKKTVDAHVRRLREALGTADRVTTVRGVGFRYDPGPS